MPTRPPRHRPTRARLPDRKPSPSARGYGTQWRALRLLYLVEHPLCETLGCGRPASQVDHVVALARGGASDQSNLRAYCHSCHSRKTVQCDMPDGWRGRS